MDKTHLTRAHGNLYVAGKSYKRWAGDEANLSGHGRISRLIYSGTPDEIAQKVVNYEAHLIGVYYGNPRDFYVYVSETKSWYRINKNLKAIPCEKPW